MAGDRDEQVADQIQTLIARLPGSAVRTLMDELDQRPPPTRRARAVRRAFLDNLNRRRPHRAQRLFMSLLEPLLIHDPLLFRAGAAVPGAFQRVDVAAVWKVLSTHVFPDLAGEVQARLDEMAEDQRIERVLLSAEALAMRARMRQAAVDYLGSCLRDRARLEPVLDRINGIALRDARVAVPGLREKPGLDAAFLRSFVHLLQRAEAMAGAIGPLTAAFPDAPGHPVEMEAQLAVIAQAETRIAAVLSDQMGPRALAAQALPILVMLNAGRRYDLVVRYIVERREDPPPHLGLVVDALASHMVGCCATMGALLANAVASAVEAGGLLTVPDAVKAEADAALSRFAVVFKALQQAGVLADRQIELRVRYGLSGASTVLGGSASTLAVERGRALTFDRPGTPPDAEDVLWLIHFIHRWRGTLGALNLASDDVDETCRAIRREVAAMYAALLKYDAADAEVMDRTLDHMVRLNRIMMAMGRNLSELFSTLSEGLRKLVLWALGRKQLDADAMAFVQSYIVQVQNQVQQSRHWISPELAEVLASYERHLGQAESVAR